MLKQYSRAIEDLKQKLAALQDHLEQYSQEQRAKRQKMRESFAQERRHKKQSFDEEVAAVKNKVAIKMKELLTLGIMGAAPANSKISKTLKVRSPKRGSTAKAGLLMGRSDFDSINSSTQKENVQPKAGPAGGKAVLPLEAVTEESVLASNRQSVRLPKLNLPKPDEAG